jgi:hypothetical protein
MRQDKSYSTIGIHEKGVKKCFEFMSLTTVVQTKEAIKLAFTTLPRRPASRSRFFTVDVETGVK